MPKNDIVNSQKFNEMDDAKTRAHSESWISDFHTENILILFFEKFFFIVIIV